MELLVLVVEAFDRIMVYPGLHTRKLSEKFVIRSEPNGCRHGQRKRENPGLQKFS